MSHPKALAPTKKNKKYSKKMPKSTKGKVFALAKDLSKLKKELRSEVEVKNYDQNNTTTLFGWDGLAVASLNNVIPQGVGQAGRVGDEILITGLDMRYVIENTSAATLCQARVIVFVDRENALPVNQVLNLPAGIVNTVTAPLSFYNRLYRDQFTILYDKMHTLDVTENSQYAERIKIPLKTKVQFQPGLTTVLNGMIKIAFIGSVNPAASPLQYRYQSRVYYTDA